MNCKKCDNTCIKNGFQVNGIQRHLCQYCNHNQQEVYTYNAYKKNTNEKIVKLIVNSCGIRDVSRILTISKVTVISRVLKIAKSLQCPFIYETDQVYEADELCVKMKGMNRCWINYAINRKTKKVIGSSVGSNNKENLKKVINKVLCLNPKKIYTDKLTAYPSLIPSTIHSVRKYQTNTIERFNLNLRTHLKRLSRKTICFSKNMQMLEAAVNIYFWVFNTNQLYKKGKISLAL